MLVPSYISINTTFNYIRYLILSLLLDEQLIVKSYVLGRTCFVRVCNSGVLLATIRKVVVELY